MKLFGTNQAATYLEMSIAALKYHIRVKNVKPQRIGHSLVFTQGQLDEFKANRRPQGRPRKEK